MQVDGSTGSKFQSVAELIASEKAARAARTGGADAVVTSEEEKVGEGLQLRLGWPWALCACSFIIEGGPVKSASSSPVPCICCPNIGR